VIDSKVNFGFIIPDTARTPDVVIIHSSYCTAKEDSFNLDCILGLYKKYDVSAHYIIDRAGGIFNLVDEKNISHHGGKGILPDGSIRVNSRSIGIELINTKSSFCTELQYVSLANLINDITTRYQIKYVLGHSDVAPKRKSDPWNFDWNKLQSMIKISLK
jgi:N-acetylmuramoyl-L-alanine amidase